MMVLKLVICLMKKLTHPIHCIINNNSQLILQISFEEDGYNSSMLFNFTLHPAAHPIVIAMAFHYNSKNI